MINEFVEEQLIRTEGKNIAILDGDRLLDLTKETGV